MLKLKLPRKEKIKEILSIPVVQWILLAFALNLVIEILNQRSLLVGVGRLFTAPLTMFYNMLLILLTVSLAGLFKRRLLATILCVLPWVAVSISNFVLQCFRSTPLSAVDLILLPSVIFVIEFYLTILEMILIVVGILAVIGLIVWLGMKSKKYDRRVKSSLITFLATAVLLVSLAVPFIRWNAISNDYSNLIKAYRDYGLPYCFCVSIFDRGIQKPDNYNEDTMDNMVSTIPDEQQPGGSQGIKVGGDVQPNIIFLQLESFVDANTLKNITCSQDPTPYYAELKNKYPSAYLTVPTYGAGTVNTEFEVIAGMNLDHFGTGEYPYMTVLQNQACETMAFNLKEHGYHTTAIHNNTLTFYDRNLVFANMGFDRFVSSEFMCDLEYTPNGWCKDMVLVEQILKAMTATEGADYVYAISVQPHGKYPDTMEEVKDMPITVDVGKKDDAETASYTYFVNQLREVDNFLRILTGELEKQEEPVMLVLYGDHLPNFELEENQVTSGDLFKTEYVIWTNYDCAVQPKDVMAYQLSAFVMELVGCDTGYITRLHQSMADDKDYDKFLELMEYDMFYGEQYIWGGKNPYKTTDLQMGYDDIRITSVKETVNGILIKGENFTDSSQVFFGKKKQTAKLINRNTLLVSAELPEAGTEVTVSQISTKGYAVFTTEKFIIE